MPTIEERVAHLEGHVSEFVNTFADIRESIRHLEHRVDVRVDAVDRRFEAIDRRFEVVAQRFDALDQKVSRQFVWLVGLVVTVLVAVAGALVTRG